MIDLHLAAKARARQSFFATTVVLGMLAAMEFISRNYAATGGFACASLLSAVLAGVMSDEGMASLLRFFAPKAKK